MPKMFLVEATHSFHEMLHYWQHVATTFGAFQMIGFHITSKAMRIVIRKLIAQNQMEVPIQFETLRAISKRDEKDIAQRQVQSFLDTLIRYESASFSSPTPVADRYKNKLFFGGWFKKQPMAKISNDLAVPFTAYQVKEIHAYSVSILRKEKEALGAYEEQIWQRAERHLGQRTAEIIALLCDWALMPPNPNIVRFRTGEIAPGSRFLLGLEELCGLSAEILNSLDSSASLSSCLSHKMKWNGLNVSMNHYESFLNLAQMGARNKKDAVRNQNIYLALAGIIEAARDLRVTHPDVLAFPHLHESILKITFPIIAEKQGKFLYISSPRRLFKSTDPDWYKNYCANVSLVLQAFGFKEKLQDRIECLYRHLSVEDSCPDLAKANSSERCYTYPRFSTAPLVNCGFLALCKGLGLTGETA